MGIFFAVAGAVLAVCLAPLWFEHTGGKDAA
jgi:hypothetical protein